MHDCIRCGQACDCDWEDHFQPTPLDCMCTYSNAECEAFRLGRENAFYDSHDDEENGDELYA